MCVSQDFFPEQHSLQLQQFGQSVVKRGSPHTFEKILLHVS